MSLPGKTPTEGYLVQIAYRVGIQGATETWAHGGAVSIDAAKFTAQGLMSARLKLMGYGARLTAVRVALLPRGGVSEWLSIGSGSAHADILVDPNTYVPPGASGRDLTNWDTSDQATSDVKVMYRNTTAGRQKITNHAAVPDNVIHIDPDGPILIGGGKWMDAFEVWKTYLIANGWGWIGRVKTAPKPVVKWQTQAETGLLQFQLKNSDASFIQNDLVLVSKASARVKGNLTPNGGPYQVSEIVTGALTTTYTLSCTESFDPAMLCLNGYVREYTLAVFAVQTAQILKQGSHRRGAPFGASRGRRMTRGLHRS